MAIPLRRFCRQRGASARSRRDLSVQADRPFQGDKWQARAPVFEVCRVQRLGLLPQDPDDHLNALFAEDSDASAIHAGIRIFGGNHNAGNASIDESLRARTSTSPVAARLQADMHRRPVGELAGLTQRENLRMWLTRAGMKSSADDPTCANQARP